MSSNEFVLPLTKDLLKYHTRWNERSLKPYTDELFDLWAENNVDGLLDTQLQGPTLTRFGIIPDDRRSADRIISLLPTYKAIFNRSDIQVYRADGHIYIDVPWQTDQVYLGDILTDSEFGDIQSIPQAIPVAIGMDIYRQSYYADLSRTPHLLVAGAGRTAFLHGIIISLLLSHAPEEIELYLCGQRRSEFDRYSPVPYCQVSSDPEEEMALLEDLNAEVDRRYAALYDSRCRTIYDFNRKAGLMKHLIVFIEEYANLNAIGKRQAAIDSFHELGEVTADAIIHALDIVDGLVVIGGGVAGAAKYILPGIMDEMKRPVGTFGGDKFPSLQMDVFNLEEKEGLAAFLTERDSEVKVPFSDRTVPYIAHKKVGGVSEDTCRFGLYARSSASSGVYVPKKT